MIKRFVTEERDKVLENSFLKFTLTPIRTGVNTVISHRKFLTYKLIY